MKAAFGLTCPRQHSEELGEGEENEGSDMSLGGKLSALWLGTWHLGLPTMGDSRQEVGLSFPCPPLLVGSLV